MRTAPRGRAGPRQGIPPGGSSSCGAIARPATGISPATAVRLLKRDGLAWPEGLEPEEPARRCQHDRPGDMTRIDVKQPIRFERSGRRAAGAWAGRRQGADRECAHLCAGDASRIACGDLFPDEKRKSAAGCLGASADRCGRLGVAARRVTTAGNGPCHTSRAFAAGAQGIRGQACPDQALYAQDQRRRRASSKRPWRERDRARPCETSGQRATGFPARTRIATGASPRRCRLEAAHQPLADGSGQAIDAPQLVH